MSAPCLDEADAVVREGLRHAYPGAVLAIGCEGGLLHLQPFGRLSYAADAPPVAPDTIYDLASVTKPLVTASVAMLLVDAGALALDVPVRRFFPAFTGGGRERVTLRQLLAHAGGLAAWAPLYEAGGGREAILGRILAMDLAREPGREAVYSDLGMILAGAVLERISGEPLDETARRRVFAPLGMGDTLFVPPPALRERIAPTEPDPWRRRPLRGEVHDENAFALGGVAPHAGLFGTAGDLARFARLLLEGGASEGRRIFSRSTVELFTTREGTRGSTRALVWDTAATACSRRSSEPGDPAYSSAGTLLSPPSFGHTGFTGCSLWIDPRRALFVILLSNRVCPRPEDLAAGRRGRDNDGIRAVRARVADAVARAFERR